MAHACERCQELEEQIRQLRAEFIESEYMPPREYRLTPTETAIYCLLHKRMGKVTRHTHLYYISRGSRHHKNIEDTNWPQLLKVYISKIRKKVNAVGGPNIVNVKSVGYILENPHASTSIELGNVPRSVAA